MWDKIERRETGWQTDKGEEKKETQKRENKELRKKTQACCVRVHAQINFKWYYIVLLSYAWSNIIKNIFRLMFFPKQYIAEKKMRLKSE